MDNLANYSKENRLKIQISLEILINALELKHLKDKFALKVSQNKFLKKHIEYEEALLILTWISKQDPLFVILNKKLRRLLRESQPYMTDWQTKNDELKEIYYQFNTTEEDLRKYFLIEVKDQEAVNKLRQIKSNLEIRKENTIEYNQISPFNWQPDHKNHRGQLILIGEAPIKFHGGNFGGVDILVSNIDHDVTTEDLRKAIFNHTQGDKNANQINISDWKYQLVNRRSIFGKHFRIEHFPPDKHRLIYKRT